MVYEWKREYFKADPQRVGEELETIENRNAETVLDFARKNEASELHACFEWDDSLAAEEYRLEQARLIMRTIVVEVECPDKEETKTIKIRAYESVRVKDDEKGMVYVPTIEALSDKEYRHQIITGLRQTIEQAERTASKYAKFIPNLERTQTWLTNAKESLPIEA